MKRFLIVMCILLLICNSAFAVTPSPSLEKINHSAPRVPFTWATGTSAWPHLLERLESVSELTTGYVLLEALEVNLDKQYSTVEWSLPIDITEAHKPFVLIFDAYVITKQDLAISDGKVIVDFTKYSPGTYYLFFYVKNVKE